MNEDIFLKESVYFVNFAISKFKYRIHLMKHVKTQIYLIECGESSILYNTLNII